MKSEKKKSNLRHGAILIAVFALCIVATAGFLSAKGDEERRSSTESSVASRSNEVSSERDKNDSEDKSDAKKTVQAVWVKTGEKESSRGSSKSQSSTQSTVNNGSVESEKKASQVINTESISIKTEVKDVKEIEYYVKKENSSSEVYLGKAEKENKPVADGASDQSKAVGDNAEKIVNNRAKEEINESTGSQEVAEINPVENWKLDIDAEKRIPNGNYILSAKIKKDDGEGEYEINQNIQVNIDNKETKNQLVQQNTATAKNVAKDSDADDLTDEDELQRGTDPFSADSDRDGYLDADEIKSGYNPLQFSVGDKSDKVVFQSPKEKGEESRKYKVEKVELAKTQANAEVMKIAGKGVPNSFVTVYIYSNNPIIVTVKTNEYGDWSYDLDKNLENGEHEVYVAVTDNTGKITSKSEPLRFVKTAEAVSVLPPAEADSGGNSPLEKSKSSLFLYFILIVIVFVALAVVLIGVLAAHEKKQ